MDSMNDSEESRTLFCGGLSTKCTEDLLYELFLQAGPLEKVRIPNDREGRPASFGFITFRHQCSVYYAINIFDGVQLYKSKLNLRLRNSNNNSAQTPTPQIYMNPYQSNQNMVSSPTILQQNMVTNQINLYQSQQNTPSNHSREYNRTPSGRNEVRNDYYRKESLQGRWNNHPYKRDRDMRPSDNRRHNNYKRHKR